MTRADKYVKILTMRVITEEYISIKEAAALMKISTRTVMRYLKQGILSYKKFPETPRGHIYILKSDIPTFVRKP